MAETVTMKAPFTGELKEVEATPDALTPLMVQGWTQVKAAKREEKADVE